MHEVFFSTSRGGHQFCCGTKSGFTKIRHKLETEKEKKNQRKKGRVKLPWASLEIFSVEYFPPSFLPPCYRSELLFQRISSPVEYYFSSLNCPIQLYTAFELLRIYTSAERRGVGEPIAGVGEPIALVK